MREPVALRAIVPRRPSRGVRRAFVAGAGEQLGEQEREHEIARGVGVRAAAGRLAEGDKEKRAEVARSREPTGRARGRRASARVAVLAQPLVAPRT